MKIHLLQPNGILYKEYAQGIDVVTVHVNGKHEVYLAANTTEFQIGTFDYGQYDIPDPSWQHLPPALFLPILLDIIKKNLSHPGGNNCWQTEMAKYIYDIYIKLETKDPPVLVRKVMDTEAALKALEHSTIKFTKPKAFNDFQEGAANRSEFCNGSDKDIKEAVEQHMEEINKYLVTCFTEGPWNYLALSLYGNKGDGVIFVYNSKKLSSFFHKELIQVHYVFYPPHLETGTPSSKALHFKHIPWEYEKEWRLILTKEEIESIRKESSDLQPDFKIDDDSELLYLNPEVLEYIYIGPKVSPENCDEIRRYANTLKIPKGNIMDIRYPINQYNIIFIKPKY